MLSYVNGKFDYAFNWSFSIWYGHRNDNSTKSSICPIIRPNLTRRKTMPLYSGIGGCRNHLWILTNLSPLTISAC